MRRIASLVAASTLAFVAVAAAAEPTVDELKAQIKTLEGRLAALEAKLDKPTPAEVGAAKAAVQDDVAKKKAAQAVSASYNNGLMFKSGDPDLFSLKFNLMSQLRYTASLGNSDRRDDENGFEFRRVRPGISGNVFSKDLTYSLVMDIDRDTGNTTLYDLFFTYRFQPDWAVKFGQFKQSLTHENDIADSKQLGVERSLVESTIGASGRVDRVQGVALIYGGTKDNPFRTEFAFTDGARSGLGGSGRDFRNGNAPGGDTNRNFGLGARGEWKIAGDWADYSDFSSKQTKETLAVVGVGVDRTEAGDRQLYTGAVDGLVKLPEGWSFYGAGLMNYNEAAVGLSVPSAANSENDALTYGAVGQIGYLINPSWEIVGRGGVIFLDNPNLFSNSSTSLSSTDDYFPEFTAGVNYYLGKDGSWYHNAKISLDFTYLPNGFPVTNTGTGTLSNEDAEYVVRFQFQLIL